MICRGVGKGELLSSSYITIERRTTLRKHQIDAYQDRDTSLQNLKSRAVPPHS